MISKVTESNKELIKARLKEISMALDGNEDSISSLESYYANITRIAPLATNFHNAPYKYFLMPLDEPVFEIDANKRTITVPTHFSKNGVGVYGDHMAEVLYFRIDKYFDYQDLFNVDEIVINWQFRGSNVSRNAELETHTSLALAPDDTFDPGHIVFGWVITEEMTPSKGTLTFSVSFLKRNGESYQYVLNTMPTSVNINDSLVLDDPQKLDDLRRPIFERLSDSRYTIDNVTPLVDPVYRTAPVSIRVDGQEVIEYKGLPVTANFVIDPDTGVESEKVLLQAIGYVSDDGNIKYTWHGTTSSGESVDHLPEDPTVPDDYVLTPDSEENSHIQYYIFDSENNEMLPLPIKEGDEVTLSVADALADPHTDVYEVGSHLDVEEAGQYQVIMQSKKVVDGVNEIISSGNVPSQTCTVPMAAVPSVALDVVGKVDFDEQVAFVNGNLIQLELPAEDQPEEGYTFVDGVAPQVIATIGIDESKIWDNVAETGVRGVTAGSSIGAIALVMTNEAGDEGKPSNEDFAGMTFKTKEERDGVNYSVDEMGGILPVDSASATGEGLYKVYAVNRRNHTYNVSDASEIINVSKVAPMLSQINLIAKKEGEESADISVLANNVAQLDIAQGEGVGIYGSITSRKFEITIGDELSNAIALYLKAVEVNKNGEIVPLPEDYNENGEVLPNSYNATLIEGTSNRYEFTIAEGGRFVIEAIAQYHGTQRITITDPFMVLAQ